MVRPRKSRSNLAPKRRIRGATSSRSFPIVGVGASAGGLEAITELLRHLPAKTGLAIVLIQHLDPAHKSVLSELLSRVAHIPVEEVHEGTVMEPDHAYVIPPNAEMYTLKGTLHLVPRSRRGLLNLPIDRFFGSMAADRKHRAIGVILSGTGSDGVGGCKVIKEAGGIIFAQSEVTSRYPDMPQSAVNAGFVDFELSPKEIAEKLVQIGAHPYVAHDLSPKHTAAFGEHDLNNIFDIVSTQMGVDFSQYKPTSLQRRIQRRMALHRFGEVADYVEFMKENPKEAEELYRDILITVTNFFREPEAFEALKTKVLGPLLHGRDPAAGLRIWIPGCATGEEAFSVAIALTEYFTEAKVPAVPFQIFASDLNEASLVKARLAVYSEAIVKDVTPERLRRFFVKQGGLYYVNKSIREACIFARQNVAKDPPFSNLDLISCRNLLIYFGAELQTRVIPTFHYALRSGGYLMLGGSETLGKFAEQFNVVDKKNRIYRKNQDAPRLLTYFMKAGVVSHEPTARHRSREQSAVHSLERQFDRALLEIFGPTIVVVNEHMEIVHLRGNTGDYLEQPSGQPSFNLNKMARPGLLIDVRAAIATSKKLERPAKRHDVEIEGERGLIRADIEVHPFTPFGSQTRYHIVAFHNGGPAPRQLPKDSGRGPGERPRSSAERFRQELAHTKEHLRALIEDHETTLEEFRTSNEEVLSSNEELQSMNEELETAKEELQSSNEELRTLNEELQNRNSELVTAHDDLSNLFSNITIPILMVASDLTIRQITPHAQSLLNVIPTDVGRRISEFHPNLRQHDDLGEIARAVITSDAARDEEVQANDGTWFLMRVRPYRTSGQRIAGAVFAFQDIDPLKRSLDDSRNYAATLVESARESVMVLDSELRVMTANNSFYKTFQVAPADTEGRFIYELGNGQWDVPQLRTLLENILPAHSRIDDFPVQATFPRIGERLVYLNARRIESQIGEEIILLAIEDVTELKRSEQTLRELSHRLLNIEDSERRRIARDLHDVTGHKIAALSLNLGSLSRKHPDAASSQTIAETLELADQITNEIRVLSYVLHPPMLDELGIVPALREYVEGVSARTRLRIQLSVQEKIPRLPNDVELAIFRVIQESLMNVHRHSGSTQATIGLTHTGNEIVLRVQDSGHGLAPETSPIASDKPGRKVGVGIAGMRERVRYLGGVLEISSGDKGTTVTARIPVPAS
jgi:two-component system, chemotaxis family, CheB/CheR fusion protein